MKKLLTLALMAGSFTAFAQQKMVADKIIGIVGDKIVLNSDIMNEINDAKRRGVEIPKGSECGMLQQALATKALVLQAEKDSLPLTDDDVEARLDLKIREFIRMYGSKDALEQVAQRTVYQIKEDFRLPIREGLLAEQMRDKLISGVKVTPAEVKEFFEKIPKDSLQFFESEYELGEIMVYPKASRDIELLAIEELNGFKKQVESGSRKFENLADLYSDDKGTQQQGGTLLLNRTEQIWDPTFKAAAFRLKEGQISPVIKSKFGFHIIQLISRSGDDALVRHILKIPQVTQTEIDEAIVKLDSVRAKLIAGTIDFGRAVALYSDDEFGKFNTGGLRVVTIDQMDKDLVKRLSQLKIGEFSQPLPFKDEREKQGVRIVYIRSKTEPHRMNMKDDYNKIAEMAKKEKEFEVLEKWFNTRIPDFYIMIDESYSGCPELAPWIKEAVISKAN
ncbi:peptidylprolyl isomerase [Parasegetibacter sp. NRK P23]|uniref:peptidylprolyl isomerase n=1 Tax=Parasegetibacter sp. NRK P23 TaxID=2942999 RepID=UPI0020438966|nr:peptidylprolyl isomerase [Parasegetibacter sp. NRK P23]MCM5527855.1 peptidylprolyl isomerase [Parasegetibacter sp. NRK P23]